MTGFVNLENNDVVRTVNFTTDTNAYASGDLIADTQEITGVLVKRTKTCTLRNITLVDKADQKLALFLVFLAANTSLGTENAAPSIADADAAADVIAVVPIAIADYVDLGDVAVATKECEIILDPEADTSLWVAIVNSTGTPTYAADSLVGKFGFSR